MILLIILVFAGIVITQAPRLKRTRPKKELVFYCIFLAIGFIVNILLTVGVKLPNPVQGVIDFLDMVHLHY